MIVKHPTYFVGKKSKDINEKRWYTDFIPYKEIMEYIRDINPVPVWIMDDTALPTNSQLMHTIHEIWEFTDENFQSGEHGHHVAGIIASSKYGLFTNVKIGYAKVLKSGSGIGFISWITNALRQGAKNNYRVMSASLGSDKPDNDMKSAILEYLGYKKMSWYERILRIKYTHIPSNFFVCAAGNDGSTTDYPAAYSKTIDGIISVGAVELVDEELRVAFYSSFGAVTFVFPGTDILSSMAHDMSGYMTGTSMATPFAAGLIATCIGINPSFDFKMLNDIAARCSTKLDKTQNKDGHGFVDVLKFLQEVKRTM